MMNIELTAQPSAAGAPCSAGIATPLEKIKHLLRTNRTHSVLDEIQSVCDGAIGDFAHTAPAAYLHTCYDQEPQLSFKVSVNDDWTSIPLYTGVAQNPSLEALIQGWMAEARQLEEAAKQEEIGDEEATLNKYCAEQLRRCIRDVEGIHGVAQAVPEGWKLVPVEPTTAQHIAAMEFALAHMKEHGVTALSPFSDYPPLRETTAGMYRAMVGAALSSTDQADGK